MSERQTLFFMPRHGTTEANQKNIFRGQEDAPLDDSGFRDAYKLADFLSYPKWIGCFCSSLTRAIQTAEIICAGRDEKPYITTGLKPLNVGDFTGQPKSPENIAKIAEYFRNPDKVIPGGESLNQFDEVKRPLFMEAMEIGLTQGVPCVVVGHSSLIYRLGEMIEGDPQACLVQPGGVVEVFLDGGEIRARAIFKPARKDDSSFAMVSNS